MQKFSIKTQTRNQMIEVTHLIEEVAKEYSDQDGCVIAFVPHTTAGITLNENADPDVVHDMLLNLPASKIIFSVSNHRYRSGDNATQNL